MNYKNILIPDFQRFMQFLSNFLKHCWLRMLKTFNKERIRCPGGFFRYKMTAVFQRKVPPTETEIKKTQIFFSQFHVVFVKFSMDSVD